MDNGACSYRRFLDGDESAFDEIMESYFHSLVFFIDKYVHDTHTAEDIAIDVFCDLVVHRNRYNFKVSLKTYLFMLGRSRALDHIKHTKVITFVELSEALPLTSDRDELITLVISNERKQRLNDAISKLPEQMSEVLHLVFFEGMSYDEAAKVMKKNRKQVDNLIYRAKKELRAVLGEDGEELI